MIYYGEQINLTCTLVTDKNHQIPLDAELYFLKKNESQVSKIQSIDIEKSIRNWTISISDMPYYYHGDGGPPASMHVDYTCKLNISSCIQVVDWQFVEFHSKHASFTSPIYIIQYILYGMHAVLMHFKSCYVIDKYCQSKLNY